MADDSLTFQALVESIRQIDANLAAQTSRAVNINLTLRNWLIGLYIAEFEMKGADRAEYGDNLLTELSKELQTHGISSTGRRQLYNYLGFYRTYPQIVQTLPAQSMKLIPASLTPVKKVRTASAQLEVPPEKLLSNLSYSHLEQLIAIDDPLKRAFYEIECMRGNWSQRELKRQIASLYYERSDFQLEAAICNFKNAASYYRDPYTYYKLEITNCDLKNRAGRKLRPARDRDTA